MPQAKRMNFMGVHCEQTLIDRLDKYVEEYNEYHRLKVSRSSLIRKAILEMFDNHPIPQKEVANVK